MVQVTRRAVVFGLAATAIAPAITNAQDETSGSETSVILSQLPGLQSAWARRYDNPNRYGYLDQNATPEPVAVTTEQLSITILEFDKESNATLSFAMGLSDETAAMILGTEPAAVGEAQDVDLGDQATLFATADSDGAAALLAIQVGNLGYLVTAWGPDGDVVESVQVAGEYMVSAEPGEGDIEFVEPADSHGGLFDLFPPRDDASLLGLIPMYEYDLLVSDHPLEYHDHPATPAS